MKVGKVALVGRPNAGKSTLINALVGKKISIVSPLPQTTRKTIQGLYWDERGQIIFLDTPGVFAKIKDPIGKKIASLAKSELKNIDLIVYLIDRSRSRGEEENRILGLVRRIEKPKIIALNKIDIKEPNYLYEYQFLEDEFNHWIEISALKKKHLKTLVEKIFELLPEGKALFNPKHFQAFPAANLTPEEFIGEIIREKVFLTLRKEAPYTTGVRVEEIDENEKRFYIKAVIFTANDRYRPMIIGKKGQTIKQIGSMARKEIELITDKKVFLDLQVTADPHWYQDFI